MPYAPRDADIAIRRDAIRVKDDVTNT